VALQLLCRRFALHGVTVAVVVVVVSGRARVSDCGKYVREEEENRKGIAGKCVWQFVSIKIMATASAISSSTFAGQQVLKPQSELSRKVGNVEARVSMRRTLKSTPESIWYCSLFSSFSFFLSMQQL
jgi:hypothetical protein